MFKIFRRIREYFKPKVPADVFTGKSFSVFVREPNQSKTGLESYIEKALIEGNAKIYPSNVKSCQDFQKTGEQIPISQSDFQIMGTFFRDYDENDLGLGWWLKLRLSYKVINIKEGTIVATDCIELTETSSNSFYNELGRFKEISRIACLHLANVL